MFCRTTIVFVLYFFFLVFKHLDKHWPCSLSSNPTKVYQVLGWTWKIPSDILFTPTLNFTGGSQKGSIFYTRRIWHVWFQHGAIYPKCKTSTWSRAAMTGLRFVPDIPSTLPLIFTGAKWCDIWPNFGLRASRHCNIKMEQQIQFKMWNPHCIGSGTSLLQLWELSIEISPYFLVMYVFMYLLVRTTISTIHYTRLSAVKRALT